MIIRQQPQSSDIKLGRAIKATVSSGLLTIEETAGLVADTVTTARTAIELVHNELQTPIAKQRLEYALVIQDGIKQLTQQGMTKEQACEYLQVPYIPTQTA